MTPFDYLIIPSIFVCSLLVVCAVTKWFCNPNEDEE